MTAPVIDWLTAQFTLVSLLVVLLVVNLGALIYAHRSRALQTELAQSRPFTQQTIRYDFSVVVAETIGALILIGAFAWRGQYTVPYLQESAPVTVQFLTFVIYGAALSMGLYPAFTLIVKVMALVEINDRMQVQIQRMLEEREELYRQAERERLRSRQNRERREGT